MSSTRKTLLGLVIAFVALAAPPAQAAITVSSTSAQVEANTSGFDPNDFDETETESLFTSFSETAGVSASSADGSASATTTVSASLTGGLSDLTRITSTGSARSQFSDSAPLDNPQVGADGDAEFSTRFEVPEGGITYSLTGSASASGSFNGFENTDPCYSVSVTLDSRIFEADHSNDVCDAGTPSSVPISVSGTLGPGSHRISAVSELPFPNRNGASGGSGNTNWTFTLVLGGACATVPKVGFAQPEGCFTETAAGSGIFETDQRAWVGGFEIVPRPGGKLVVDTVSPGLSAAGAGADVVFAGFAVPIPLAAIPVGQQDATFEIGQPGTVIAMLDLPLEASVKVSWASDGKSASYEQEVKVEKLTEGIGELVTLSPNESVGETAGKLKASLKNGEGFVVESGEIAINEINVVPRALRIRRTLKLKNLLLKFERRAEKPFWTGRAGIGLPLARGDLDVTGTVFAFDGDLAGGGLEVDGINKRVLGPFFLQKAGGDIAFAPIASPPPGVIAAPEFGYDVRVGGTLGPRVEGKELVSLDGTIQGGSLVADCEENVRRPDPTKLQAVAKLAPLEGFEDANLAKVDITQRACVYPGTGAEAAAIEGTLDGEITFLDAYGYKGTQTGFISTAGASYEGAVQLRLPGPDLDGSAIISTVGMAACADFTFFEGGFGGRWASNAPPPELFDGCDLGEFRLLQAPSRLLAARRGTAGAINLPAGLPHAGFAATATTGPPLVTVSGPGGVTVTSPADGSALRAAGAVIVPVPHENTTYVFVNDPKAGSWRVESTDPANPLTQVRLSEGLPDPKAKGKVATGKRRFRLSYALRDIDGQKVTFYERGQGIAQKLGKARNDEGTLTFKPTLALDRKRTIAAEVTQDGIPRELITVANFKAPKLPKLKAPKLAAKRTKKSLKLSWPRIAGASEYLVEVTAGAEVLFRVVTAKRKLRFPDTPTNGKLKVTANALSEIQPTGPAAKLTVKPPR